MSDTGRYKKRLSLKFTVGFLILGFFVIASGCVVGYVKYTDVIEKMYNDEAYHIAYTVRESLDGDWIEKAAADIRTADDDDLLQISRQIQDDEEYRRIVALIDMVRMQMGANYIYIADQTDKSGNVVSTLTYIADADNPADDMEPFRPGDRSAMNESFLEDSQYIYETGKRSDNYFYSHSDFGYNTSAIVPVENSDGEAVAIIGVELAMKTLEDERREYVTHVIFLGALLTAIVIVIFLAYLRHAVIRPIQLVTDEVDAFVHNETEVSEKLLQISTGDEIEQMAKSVRQMEIDINSYIDKLTSVTAERERIGAELDIAAKIQTDMLPSIFPAFPDREEFDLYASMVTAKEVGGDFYDFFMVDDDHLTMVIADVSGKGVPAALFMVVSKTLLKNYAQSGLSAQEVLETVNDRLYENNRADMFVTAWIGILQISTGKMDCANAGHEYPAICRRSGRYERLKDRHGFVLAGMENIPQHGYEILLEPGDRLFLYTDGVPEATGPNEEMFGPARMLDALNAAVNMDPKDTILTVKRRIDRFTEDCPQFDDITMMCLQYRGAESARLHDSITLAAIDENIPKVTEFAEMKMQAADVPVRTQMQINIAIDELFSNIAHYAYPQETGEAAVDIDIDGAQRAVELTFRDRGIPYDPLAKEAPDVTGSAEEREIGGVGIFIVKQSMDEMFYEYRDGQNILRIRKKFETCTEK
ncbi:ATP-binding SpoIIE family protein phosphatase [Gallibacter sp. Marseille-QA0791]|uniref:ATP-binding SpoIIE family protein phosphatase n=1 Tax=Gallibacter sp. Marseille-QA0791 TaxID=3378781 RepID=UPI003D1336FA